MSIHNLARNLGFSFVDYTTTKLLSGRRIKNMYFTMGTTLLAPVSSPIWVAPYACVLVSGYVTYRTAAGATLTVQIAKAAAGVAPDSGTNLLSAAFNGNTTADTPIALSVASGNSIAVGDAIVLKKVTGTDYGALANVAITLVLKWS